MAEKAEDLNLPLSVITRIIKDSLPEGAQVSKEARVAISRAASVFVLHATTYAHQSALNAKRKTITGQDILSSLQDMELDSLVEPLEKALAVWHSEQKSKAAARKAKKLSVDAERRGTAENDDAEEDQVDKDDASDEPLPKIAKESQENNANSSGEVQQNGKDDDSDSGEDEAESGESSGEDSGEGDE